MQERKVLSEIDRFLVCVYSVATTAQMIRARCTVIVMAALAACAMAGAPVLSATCQTDMTALKPGACVRAT